MRSGLVLSGGGANGAYELGVLKALLLGGSPATAERPLHADCIAATSIGSFNAAVLLSHYHRRSWHEAVTALESVWIDQIAAPRAISSNGVFRYRPNFIDWFDVAQFRLNPWQPARVLAGDVTFLTRDWLTRVSGLVSGSGGLAHRFAELFDLSTFITPEPSERLVRSVVHPARIREAPIALRMTATQWEKGTLRIFANADFTDAAAASIVRASGAIPGIFQPVRIGGELFVDGGVVLNTPLKPAIDAGADVLHVIYLDPEPGALPLRSVGSTIDTMGRMFVASFAATMRRDIDVAASINRDVVAGRRPERRPITIHLYHPHEDTGGALGMLDFHRERIVALIDRGYRDAVAHDCAASGCLNVGRSGVS
jgi:NTE family protein